MWKALREKEALTGETRWVVKLLLEEGKWRSVFGRNMRSALDCAAQVTGELSKRQRQAGGGEGRGGMAEGTNVGSSVCEQSGSLGRSESARGVQRRLRVKEKGGTSQQTGRGS